MKASDIDNILMQAIIGDDPIEYNQEGQRRAEIAKQSLYKLIDEEVIGPDLPLIPHSETGKVSDSVKSINYEKSEQRAALKRVMGI